MSSVNRHRRYLLLNIPWREVCCIKGEIENGDKEKIKRRSMRREIYIREKRSVGERVGEKREERYKHVSGKGRERDRCIYVSEREREMVNKSGKRMEDVCVCVCVLWKNSIPPPPPPTHTHTHTSFL